MPAAENNTKFDCFITNWIKFLQSSYIIPLHPFQLGYLSNETYCDHLALLRWSQPGNGTMPMVCGTSDFHKWYFIPTWQKNISLWLMFNTDKTKTLLHFLKRNTIPPQACHVHVMSPLWKYHPSACRTWLDFLNTSFTSFPLLP